MQLSENQSQALSQVEDWFIKKEKPVFRLFGYAGTGKTTLAKYFAEKLDTKVCFAAYTGKAAQVLRMKGAFKASTIHSLIYKHVGGNEIISSASGKKTFEPSFILNKDSELTKSGLVIIDECSMVDEKLGKDLLSFGVPVLVLGDSGQLPPIIGGGFFTNRKADVQLTEIFRQDSDNVIIHFSKLAREGKEFEYGDYGDVKVINRSDLTKEMVLEADQILVGMHKTKNLYNTRIRQHLGFDDILPVVGDKLVAQRNNWQKGLLNGSSWKVMQCSMPSTKPYINLLVLGEYEDNATVKIKLLKEQFENREEEIPWQVKRNFDDFDYGYVLTVHKAQGSQWDNVLIFDESRAFRQEKEKWLYTGITRAAKSLTIVR